jgi:hypothetical protein
MTEETPAQPKPPPDPMKSFRGIVVATLILEAIVLALALLVVAKQGDGVGSGQGYLVLGLIAALIVTCGLLRQRWYPWLIALIHVVMLVATVSLVALGIVGALFAMTWLAIFLMRRDVEKKMAAGTLPSQRQS